jgi:hypothetical protein
MLGLLELTALQQLVEDLELQFALSYQCMEVCGFLWRYGRIVKVFLAGLDGTVSRTLQLLQLVDGETCGETEINEHVHEQKQQ